MAERLKAAVLKTVGAGLKNCPRGFESYHLRQPNHTILSTLLEIHLSGKAYP